MKKKPKKHTGPTPKEIRAFQLSYLDFGCSCGFPHPRKGHLGPPPNTMEKNGKLYDIGHYAGLLASDIPWQDS